MSIERSEERSEQAMSARAKSEKSDPAINVAEIPVGEGRAFVVDGHPVAVFRLRDGTVRALAATCPHRGGPLADGLVDGRVVVCPLHGFTYDLATGLETGRAGESVPAYDVAVQSDGTVLVRPRG